MVGSRPSNLTSVAVTGHEVIQALTLLTLLAANVFCLANQGPHMATQLEDAKASSGLGVLVLFVAAFWINLAIVTQNFRVHSSGSSRLKWS